MSKALQNQIDQQKIIEFLKNTLELANNVISNQIHELLFKQVDFNTEKEQLEKTITDLKKNATLKQKTKHSSSWENNAGNGFTEKSEVSSTQPNFTTSSIDRSSATPSSTFLSTQSYVSIWTTSEARNKKNHYKKRNVTLNEKNKITPL